VSLSLSLLRRSCVCAVVYRGFFSVFGVFMSLFSVSLSLSLSLSSLNFVCVWASQPLKEVNIKEWNEYIVEKSR
jgi:uncharacterized Tic20 family protein